MFIYKIQFCSLLKWIWTVHTVQYNIAQHKYRIETDGRDLASKCMNNIHVLYLHLTKSPSSSFTCHSHSSHRNVDALIWRGFAWKAETTRPAVLFQFQFMWIFTHRVKEKRYRTYIFYDFSLVDHSPGQMWKMWFLFTGSNT